MARQVILNGDLVPYDAACLHINSVAMRYAASVFEGIRGYWNESKQRVLVLALREHLERLMDSMRIMRFEIQYSIDQITEWVWHLLEANGIREDCYIRCSASVISHGDIVAAGEVGIFIDVFPMGRKPKSDTGISVAISSWERISVRQMSPRVKCIANYQNGRLAMMQARQDGYDNVLLLNEQGFISEAPTACVFFVFRSELVTPLISDNILPSITRSIIMKLGRQRGIGVVERHVDRIEAYLADEAFLCGTGIEIMPICSIDGHAISAGLGLITQALRDQYFILARDQLSTASS